MTVANISSFADDTVVPTDARLGVTAPPVPPPPPPPFSDASDHYQCESVEAPRCREAVLNHSIIKVGGYLYSSPHLL